MFPLKRAINGRPLQAESGFTLLEIMVSLFIIAIVFVAVFRLQARTISLADSENFYAIAPYLARIVLSTPDKDLADATDLSGKFDKDYHDWSWHLTLHDLDVMEGETISENAAKQLKRLDVTISRGSQDLSLSTWRYIPHD